MKVVIDGIEYVPKPDAKGCQVWSERIRTTRCARKDSLEAMARETGLSKTYLHELENGGAVEPGIGTIRALLRYSGATFEDFFGVT